MGRSKGISRILYRQGKRRTVKNSAAELDAKHESFATKTEKFIDEGALQQQRGEKAFLPSKTRTHLVPANQILTSPMVARGFDTDQSEIRFSEVPPNFKTSDHLQLVAAYGLVFDVKRQLWVRKEDLDHLDNFTAAYATAQTGATIITPSAGKRLIIRKIFVNSDAAAGAVKFDFSSSSKAVLYIFYSGVSGLGFPGVAFNDIYVKGAVDEPLSLTSTTSTSNVFICVQYTEEAIPNQ